jgi:cell division septal protein FtsQ
MMRLGRFVVLTGVIILLIVGLAGWLLWGSDLTIHEIAVEGGERIPVETVQDLIPVHVGENLWQVNADQVRFALLQQSAWIREVRVAKEYPNRLRVIVQERVPFVVIEPAGRSPVWIDEEGYVLESERASKIFQPRIRGLHLVETPIGSRIADADALQALRDLFTFEGSFLAPFEEVRFDRSDVTLTSRVGFQVYLKIHSVKGDLSQLQRVLDVIDASEYQYFDFRYNQLIAKPR